MASKMVDETTLSSEQNLTCPLCLDIFDEPTSLTSCQHTFCKKCLKKYDLSHQDLDHMVCPLCRKITKFSTNRVDDLHINMTVNELVDDYHAKCGGINAVLEKSPQCTSCRHQKDAVSFCKTCGNYICDKCLECHHILASLEDHDIISMDDIMDGNVIIGQPTEKCSVHKQENKDMFCEGCKKHVCVKCVVISHRDHKIESHEDFEKKLQTEVDDLIQRCTAKKSELEKNIQRMEAKRLDVHTAIEKLREDINQAYSVKAKQLEENQRKLVDQIDTLKRSFDDDFDVLKSKDRQKIKSICSSMTLVANDRLGRLETDSLSAHILLCEELKNMLKEYTDHTSAAAITKKAQKKKFTPADDTRLDLGTITEPDLEPTQGAMVKGTTQSHQSSTVNIRDKAQEKLSDNTRLDPGSISSPNVQVIRRVDLRSGMWGMTKYSDDSVAIVYGSFWIARGIDIIDSTGNTQQCTHSSDEKYDDLVFLRDRSFCVSTGNTGAYIYSPNGTKISTIQVRDTGNYLRLNKSPSDEIIVANGGKEVYIYDPTGTTLKHTIPTKHETLQASATKSGLIIASSCNIKPSTVTVYDRNGNAGKPLQAPCNDVYLYATVDEHDRVYVASVDSKNDKVVIRLYDIDGLNLKERVEFNTFNMTPWSAWWGTWCYMVSLSPGLLAFASGVKLYFIKVSQ